MKYIIIRNGTFLFPIIFPEQLTHAQVAAGFKPAEGFQIHSAGFYGVLNRDCTGESVSLQISSKPGDRELCNAFVSGGDALLQLAQLELLRESGGLSASPARTSTAAPVGCNVTLPPPAQGKLPIAHRPSPITNWEVPKWSGAV